MYIIWHKPACAANTSTCTEKLQLLLYSKTGSYISAGCCIICIYIVHRVEGLTPVKCVYRASSRRIAWHYCIHYYHLSVLNPAVGPNSFMHSTMCSSKWTFLFCSSSGWHSFTTCRNSWHTSWWLSSLLSSNGRQ